VFGLVVSAGAGVSRRFADFLLTPPVYAFVRDCRRVPAPVMMDGSATFCGQRPCIGRTHPHVVVPPDLTIALMGWVEMRVMTALNTIAPGADGDYVFGKLPEPPAAAEVGQAWMRMLTLQLGILLKPYLIPPGAPAIA
jgi:hypothetical protein